VRRDHDGGTVLQGTLSTRAHPFLLDHPLGGRVSDDASLRALPVCPLAMTLALAAEAATAAAPGLRPASIRAVRDGRWVAFPDEVVTLEVVARPGPDGSVHVAARRLLADGRPESDPPVLTCSVQMAPEGPAAPAPAGGVEALRGARPGRWSPAELYGDRQPHGMFHGPVMRGVAAVSTVGADGADGVLRALPTRGLFAGEDAPALAFDPVLLDAAGQVLGFWNADVGDPAVVLFPVAVDEIVFGGPAPAAGTELACRVRVRASDGERVVADIVVVDGAGGVRLRLSGWETRRFHLPQGFYAFRLAPRDGWLSEPLDHGIIETGLAGARFEPPAGFLEADGGIWREAMAHLVLGPRERETWRALRGPETRRRDWLIGRVAAKDAVRRLIQGRHGMAFYPADVEIVTDEHGRPRVAGAWCASLPAAPVVSLSHSGGIAVAIAGESPADGGVGIDLERIGAAAADFERVAFNAEERALLADLPADARSEWALRFWCAKEAVAKALGRSHAAGPHDAIVQAPDRASGLIALRLAGELAKSFPRLSGGTVSVRTVRDGDTIVAVSVLGAATSEPEAA
jgi:phosphopantetheinyl transferase